MSLPINSGFFSNCSLLYLRINGKSSAHHANPKNGTQINTQDLGASIKKLNQNHTIKMGNKEHKEESVDDLLLKLAQKGKKVKLIDENQRDDLSSSDERE